MSATTCTNHPDRAAPSVCAGCSRPFCDGCLVRFEKLLLCETCKGRFLAGVDDRPIAPRDPKRAARSEAPRGRPLHWILGSIALLFSFGFGLVIIAALAEPWQAFSADRKLATAFDRLVLVGAALERYRVDAGRYPEKLGDLVPKYLTELPEDPYAGAPPRYQDGPRRLWSVGPDGKDDGGEIPADIVYPVENGDATR